MIKLFGMDIWQLYELVFFYSLVMIEHPWRLVMHVLNCLNLRRVKQSKCRERKCVHVSVKSDLFVYFVLNYKLGLISAF